jgi:hypothetical protein
VLKAREAAVAALPAGVASLDNILGQGRKTQTQPRQFTSHYDSRHKAQRDSLKYRANNDSLML